MTYVCKGGVEESNQDMDTVKVSVIVPVYNVEPYIRECLDSLLEQTLRDIEVIVVDDGSPDNCGQIIDEYASKDSRIKPIHKKNAGVSAARNDGISCITGEYTFFCDSDDWLEKDAFEKMVKKADETKSDVIISDYRESDGISFTLKKMFDREFVADDSHTLSVIQNTVLPKTYTALKSAKFERGYCLGAPWHHLIRSSLILDNHLTYDTYVRGMFDDGLFMLNVFEHAKRVIYISTVTYNYRIVAGSITNKFSLNILETYQRVYEKLFQFGNEHNKSDDYYNAVYIRVIGYLNKSMDVFFFHKQNESSDKERYRLFVDTVKSQPYKDAIEKVDISTFYLRKTRILVTLLRLHLYWLYWIIKTMNH